MLMNGTNTSKNYNRSDEYLRLNQELGNLIEELRGTNVSVLPTEQELTKKFNVGRNLLRKVVGDYVERGWLERIQGKGTFISSKTNVFSFTNWVSSELSHNQFIGKIIAEYKNNVNPFEIHDISIPYYQYVNKVLDMFLHGSPPDIIQTNTYWLRRFQKLNLFIPLDSYISPEIIKRKYSTALDLGKVNDEIIALNWTLEPLVLYYNKIVMEKVGLDPDNPPDSLEELKQLSIRVNESNKDVYGFCLPFEQYEHSLMCIYVFLLAFNGGFCDQIGNIIIDSEENVSALNWLADFYSRGGAPGIKSINDARILFASDKVAFFIEGPAGRGNFRQISGLGKDFDSHYGVVKIPKGPLGFSKSVLLAHSLSISKYCSDPVGAYNWIEYLSTNEKNAKLYFELFGMIPCNRNLLEDEFFSKDPFASVLIDQLDNATIGPINHPLFLRSVPFLISTFSKIITKQITVEAGIDFIKEVVTDRKSVV